MDAMAGPKLAQNIYKLSGKYIVV